jgi:hypothetical protein
VQYVEEERVENNLIKSSNAREMKRVASSFVLIGDASEFVRDMIIRHWINIFVSKLHGINVSHESLASCSERKFN